MRKNMTVEKFNEGLKVLEQNEWYWEMDSEYRRKYRIVKDSAESTNLAEGNWGYAWNMLDFLLEANARIFR